MKKIIFLPVFILFSYISVKAQKGVDMAKASLSAKQEAADYHNVVVFGRQAETVAQYMKKGSQVMVEGRMQTRSWDDAATGTKKYRTEIIADRVQFGSGGGVSVPRSDSPKASSPKEEDEGE